MISAECSKAVVRRAMAATQASSTLAWLGGSRRHYVTPPGVCLRATSPSPSPARQSKTTSRGLCIVANSSSSFLAEPSSAKRASQAGPPPPNGKIVKLRQRLASEGIDAYIIPSEDPHQSEYSADCFMRRAYISEFTGSAGTAVITKDSAALWTDGRYFLQAENQLGPDWQLMRAGTPGVPSYGEWLRDQLNPGASVAIDPLLFSIEAARELERCLLSRDQKLVLLEGSNLVDDVWGDARPKLPTSPLRVHDLKFSGVDVATKLGNLRKDLTSAGATAIAVTMLDEVAWLFNLRGNDVPHNPVAYAYAMIELETATLFTDLSKITDEVSLHLKEAQIAVKPYTSILSFLERLASNGCKLWLDPARVNIAVFNAFNAACKTHYRNCKKSKKAGQAEKISSNHTSGNEMDAPYVLERTSPVPLAKAKKNAAELNGMRQAHLRDAAALVEFLAWLENTLVVERKQPTEVEVADVLLGFRKKQKGFLDTSFDTISGSGPNGAIIHYRAEPESCRAVDDKHVFLLDSGAQYVDGTTDVTRTFHFGTPTARHKECFTRVLQGHIAVDKAVFPEGTPGFVLDVLARSSLWKIGLDYRHGTGHGVGAALNVHEGPQSISARFGNMTGLEAGMIVSNEPGYYEDRSFGIRIENLLVVGEVNTANRFGGITYLGFEKLTFVPIQKNLMDVLLLSQEDIDWVNNYHQDVWEKVSPLVEGNTLAWLKQNTRPLSKSSC
ncbi:hypothetical protein GOP47_0007713 [Adiantum capillus-veneris]|uniref:Xaa-Pro aminopeptidase P n=1 Tax=Adiantum capillus-veneris TaxID=13818 RepID=A0A9D4ZJK1_ADICA|nr:hypothetical protein GOP47_0007713 [Adiantum capillus-veneris]